MWAAGVEEVGVGKRSKQHQPRTSVSGPLADADAGHGDGTDGAAAVLAAVRPVLDLQGVEEPVLSSQSVSDPDNLASSKAWRAERWTRLPPRLSWQRVSSQAAACRMRAHRLLHDGGDGDEAAVLDLAGVAHALVLVGGAWVEEHAVVALVVLLGHQLAAARELGRDLRRREACDARERGGGGR